MKLKERVLSALEANRGEYLSGEALASSLSVSRNAIWKAIGQLEKSGHTIHALPKRGYCLSLENAVLSPQSIEKYLRHKSFTISAFETIDSTNTQLKILAEAGAKEGTVIVAESQSAGHGRRGRYFHSPAVGGIYLSLLLRPNFTASESLCITTCAAVAVCRAIEKHTEETCSIKWVNDIFCHGKKVCGISTQGALDLETGGLHYAILGIGLNLFPGESPFPEDLQQIAGTILTEKPKEDLRSPLVASILDYFWENYPSLTEKQYFDDYRNRCFILGEEIFVHKENKTLSAKALALSENFELLVSYPQGEEEFLSSGEVSIAPKQLPKEEL